MAIPSYNGEVSEGLIPQAIAGLFRYVMTAVNDNKGVAAMSLSDGSFNLAARGDDPYAMGGVSLDVDLPEDGYSESMDAQNLFSQAPDALLDGIVARQIDNQANMNGPLFSGPDAQPAEKPTSNLQSSFANASAFQGETVKLKPEVITSASGPGARSVDQYNTGKADAVSSLKAEVTQARQEIQGGPAPAPDGGGIARAAFSAACGLVVDAVVPGLGTAATVAAIGAGSFGKQNSGEFSSPAANETSVYRTAEGHSTADIMAGGNMPAPAAAGQNLLGEIECIVNPSLAECRPTFGTEQLAAIEKVCDQMDRDVRCGQNAYNNWRHSDVSVTESIGNTPTDALKVRPGDEFKVLTENVAPKMNAMGIA